MPRREKLKFKFWGGEVCAEGPLAVTALLLLAMTVIMAIIFFPVQAGTIATAINGMARIRGP